MTSLMERWGYLTFTSFEETDPKLLVEEYVFTHTAAYQFKSTPNSHTASIEIIRLKIKIKRSTILFGCLYRPPDQKVHFWTDLEKPLEGLEGHDVILVGDINVEALNSNDPNYSHLMNICLSLNLSNMVEVPTRYSATTQKCIDPILTSCNYVTTVRATHVDFTDHASIDLPITWPATATLLCPKRKLFAPSYHSLFNMHWTDRTLGK